MTVETIERPTTQTEISANTSFYPMYKVLMHNDNKTTMQFVVDTLRTIFCKEEEEAYKIMMEIHTKGIGLAGVYILEHAEMKIEQTHSKARARGFPLALTMEPDN